MVPCPHSRSGLLTKAFPGFLYATGGTVTDAFCSVMMDREAFGQLGPCCAPAMSALPATIITRAATPDALRQSRYRRSQSAGRSSATGARAPDRARLAIDFAQIKSVALLMETTDPV